MWFPVAVLRLRAKLFQCQYVGIDLPFTSNYSSRGDGRQLLLYRGDAGGTLPSACLRWPRISHHPGERCCRNRAPHLLSPCEGRGDACGCGQGLLALV